MTTLTFHDTEIQVIEHKGQKWLTAASIAKALGYTREDAVSGIFHRNRQEFNGDLSETVNLKVSGNLTRKTRLFNRRGAHLIAMLAKTERAKDFRKWVLDVLEEKTTPQPETPVIEGKIQQAVTRMLQEVHTHTMMAVYPDYPEMLGKAIHDIHLARTLTEHEISQAYASLRKVEGELRQMDDSVIRLLEFWQRAHAIRV